jgi:hypothetical protein
LGKSEVIEAGRSLSPKMWCRKKQPVTADFPLDIQTKDHLTDPMDLQLIRPTG